MASLQLAMAMAAAPACRVRYDLPRRSPGSLHCQAADTLEVAGSSSDGGARVGERQQQELVFGRQFFPLASIVGQDAIKSALLLDAVHQSIGGIAIAGRRGTAKTVMARGLHVILPPLEVVAGSVCNADPNNPEDWEEGLADEVQYNDDGSVVTEITKAPFIQIPLGVTELCAHQHDGLPAGVARGVPSRRARFCIVLNF